jgi:hypothetical protein
MYPVVYMALDVMILMYTNQFQGTLEGLGPEMATSKASAIWA